MELFQNLILIPTFLMSKIQVKISLIIFFSEEDLGKEKAILITERGLSINSQINFDVMLGKIDEKNLLLDVDVIWETVDIIIGALDYRVSKNYLNSKAIWYEKPFLTTLVHGLNCSSEIVIPNLTEDYNDGGALSQQIYDKTLIWKFPHIAEHAIQWAREVFILYFQDLSIINKLLTRSDLANKRRFYLNKMKDRVLILFLILNYNEAKLKRELKEIKLKK